MYMAGGPHPGVQIHIWPGAHPGRRVYVCICIYGRGHTPGVCMYMQSLDLGCRSQEWTTESSSEHASPLHVVCGNAPSHNLHSQEDIEKMFKELGLMNTKNEVVVTVNQVLMVHSEFELHELEDRDGNEEMNMLEFLKIFQGREVPIAEMIDLDQLVTTDAPNE